MARYKCHKEVQAWAILKITDFYFQLDGRGAMRRDPKMESRYTPKVGDYVVRYGDGFVSISPKLQFEEGYARLD